MKNIILLFKQLLTKQSALIMLVFCLGFVVGGGIPIVSFADGIQQAWIVSAELSTSPNMPLHKLVDNLSTYYITYGLMVVGVVIGFIFWYAPTSELNNS